MFVKKIILFLAFFPFFATLSLVDEKVKDYSELKNQFSDCPQTSERAAKKIAKLREKIVKLEKESREQIKKIDELEKKLSYLVFFKDFAPKVLYACVILSFVRKYS